MNTSCCSRLGGYYYVYFKIKEPTRPRKKEKRFQNNE